MKQRALKWTVICAAVIGALAALLHLAVVRYLDRRAERFRREVSAVERFNAEYRRPLLFGDPLEGNAATWYGLALRHVPPDALMPLMPVVKGGPERLRQTLTPIAAAQCAESRSDRVKAAMRSTQCDWHVNFDPRGLEGVEDSRAALVLGQCLVIDGHRARAHGDARSAATAYLKALALGSDLGVGTSSTALAGFGSVMHGLEWLSRLIADSTDLGLLSHIRSHLSKVGAHLPDGRLAVHRDRLWLENAIVSDNSRPWRGRAAWWLWRTMPLLDEFDRLATVPSREFAEALAETIKRHADRSPEARVRVFDLGHQALLRVSGFELVEYFRATEAAIDLQEWRIEHGTYPTTVAALNLSIESRGLRYESLGQGSGYKLIGRRRTMIDTSSMP